MDRAAWQAIYSPWGHKESERLKQFSMHSGWLCGKESACNAGDMGSIPELGEPLQKEMATHSSILAWRIPWQRSLAGYSPRGFKSWT